MRYTVVQVRLTWPEQDDKIQRNADNSDNAAALLSNLRHGTETTRTK